MVKTFLIVQKKSTTDAIKNCFKKRNPKIAERTGDSIGNKNADKITSVSKNLQQNCAHKIMKQMMNRKHQMKHTYHQKKENKLLMN